MYDVMLHNINCYMLNTCFPFCKHSFSTIQNFKRNVNAPPPPQWSSDSFTLLNFFSYWLKMLKIVPISILIKVYRPTCSSINNSYGDLL